MPHIPPSEFEYYLPKESDSVAKALLKFAQFAIVFWRWFRTAFNEEDGTMTKHFKEEFCNLDRATGCIGKPVIPGPTGPGVDPPIVHPGPNPGPTPSPLDCTLLGDWISPSCCDPVYNYGKDAPEDVGDINKDSVRCNGKLHFFQDVQHNHITGALDMLCDADGHKQMAVITPGATLTSNGRWSQATIAYNSPRNEFAPYPGIGEGVVPPIFLGASGQSNVGELLLKSGTWVNTEVVIYGHTDNLIPPPAAKKGAKVLGFFTTNPNNPELESKSIRFHVENGGDWCVRLAVDVWPEHGKSSDGWPRRHFSIRFSREIPYEWNPQFIAWDEGTDTPGKLPKSQIYWPQEYTSGTTGLLKKQRHLTKINGIRITLLGGWKDKMDMAERYGHPVQVGNRDSDHGIGQMSCVYDERWQNERQCYMPQRGHAMQGDEVATTFSSDGKVDTPKAYRNKCVNDLDVTFESSTYKEMIEREHFE